MKSKVIRDYKEEVKTVQGILAREQDPNHIMYWNSIINLLYLEIFEQYTDGTDNMSDILGDLYLGP